MKAVFTLLLVCIPFVSAPAANRTIPYDGTAFQGTVHVDRVRVLIDGVNEEAARRAELRTGLTLDRSRLDLRIVDVPPGQTFFHVAMSAGGFDTVTVRVPAQVWLRSASRDSAAALTTLTHEYVHVVLRQHMTPSSYVRLPNWFQEGVAVRLAGQHGDKLRHDLAMAWRRPEKLYESLADGPAEDDYLAGSWWFAALESLRGDGATRTLLASLAGGASLYDALTALDCSIEDLWIEAQVIAEEEVAATDAEAAAKFRSCMLDHEDDRENRLACLDELIGNAPRSYVAEYALLKAAVLAYRLQYDDRARAYLRARGDSRLSCGQDDEALYLEIALSGESGNHKETRRLCYEYLALWPDGKRWGRVRNILQETP